jgi:hypothetical protein
MMAQKLASLSCRVNAILEHLDPEHYQEAVKINEQLKKLSPGMWALSFIDPLVYQNREILFNKMSSQHTDKQDPPLGWAILAGFGDYVGGEMKLPQLGLTIRYEPGDIIAIRGRVLRHEIDPNFVGQRISIPHFTHSSTWRACGNTSVFI